MGPLAYSLFDTPFGACGIAWSDRGITRIQLPEASQAATERRVRFVGNDAGPVLAAEPPPEIFAVISDLQKYLSGTRVDFAGIPLDLTREGSFSRKVYAAARTIGWGEVTTYGDLSLRAGMPGAARAVGRVLGRNPVAILVPCHRVLAASAAGVKPGGFSAFGGTALKLRLLALEGVSLTILQGESQLVIPFPPGETGEPGRSQT